jgi:hypothetical protein
MKFITLIQAIYGKAFCSGQINGYVTGLFHIQRSVTEICTVNNLLFALVLNQLVCLLESLRSGVRIGNRANKTAVVTYADDLMIIAVTPADI